MSGVWSSRRLECRVREKWSEERLRQWKATGPQELEALHEELWEPLRRVKYRHEIASVSQDTG
jgi:hypothetical protein